MDCPPSQPISSSAQHRLEHLLDLLGRLELEQAQQLPGLFAHADSQVFNIMAPLPTPAFAKTLNLYFQLATTRRIIGGHFFQPPYKLKVYMLKYII